MDESINNSLNEKIGDPVDIREYIPLVKAHVRVRIISEIKRYIDSGAIEQEMLLDISNRELLIEILQKLICNVWDELEINISNVMLENNLVLAIEIYNYMTRDFKLLSMNYRVNKNDLYFNPPTKKKILLTTIEVLKEKIKYIDDDSELEDEFINVLNTFEHKVANYENSKQLTALLTAMRNAKIHILMNVDAKSEKLIYPEILDLFKDYFYLKYVFYANEERINVLREDLRNKQIFPLSPADNDLLIQLGIADRSQVPSYLRNAYEVKPMYEFNTLKVLLRQMLKDDVAGQKKYASCQFEDVSSFPLPLYKYTLLCGEQNIIFRQFKK